MEPSHSLLDFYGLGMPWVHKIYWNSTPQTKPRQLQFFAKSHKNFVHGNSVKGHQTNPKMEPECVPGGFLFLLLENFDFMQPSYGLLDGYGLGMPWGAHDLLKFHSTNKTSPTTFFNETAQVFCARNICLKGSKKCPKWSQTTFLFAFFVGLWFCATLPWFTWFLLHNIY